MGLTEIIVSVGVVQGFILAFVLITLNLGNQKANRILGLLMMVFSMVIGTLILVTTEAYKSLPHLLAVTNPMVFLIGPLFLLYAHILMSKTRSISKIFWLNFLPFVFSIIYWTPFYLQSGMAKIEAFENPPAITAFDYILTTAQIVHLIVYLLIVNNNVKHHQKKLKETFSSTDKINLEWIRKGIHWLFGVSLLLVFTTVVHSLGFEDFSEIITTITISLIVVIFYGIGYSGLKQPEIFRGLEETKSTKKYENSTLSVDDAIKYENKLLFLMKTEKPYTNSNLTIRELAKLSNIPYYYISQILSERIGQKFSDFVNRYRIEDAKEKLLNKDFDHYSILGIAIEVGFNSKSAFNTAFKKYTNQTPTQFRSK